MWVICRKNKGDFIGGEILAGYCTCTAGLLGSCNHVAGLLFRVEAAVLTGYCNPTCTSTLATWNIPRGKKQIQPDEVSKFLFTQDTYMKKGTQETLEKWKSKAEVKKAFGVMTGSQFDRFSNRKIVRQEFFNEACAIIPTSFFVELIESKQKKYTPSQKSDIPTLFDLAARFKDSCDPELDSEMPNEMFTDSIIHSDQQISNIHKITKNN